MIAASLLVIAIVTQDKSALRSAPRDSAPQQAVLAQGDNLELRGQKGDYLQVYDHRHERAGFVRATQVRSQSLKPEAAPELLSIVRFLRDTPGAESLGIGYAAAYLRAAPAEAINGEAFEAQGAMAERLAHRASARNGKQGDDTLAAHLEVAASYGVQMLSFERDGQVQLCCNGDAHRRVLALRATDSQKALAALALTKHECVAPKSDPGRTLYARQLARRSAGSGGDARIVRSSEEPLAPAQGRHLGQPGLSACTPIRICANKCAISGGAGTAGTGGGEQA